MYVSNVNLKGLCGKGIEGGREGGQTAFHSIFDISSKGWEESGILLVFC